ncbi:hypothetical protein LEP1GSC047_3776 [Leptospira inadai serovar Lyme str. 10]|uniref:Uncharacterized protein n=1 Tax=Leptospira inadai serovar Lyme str. 10 TaxID=1049790 RepID=V6HK52_9LEPT|nr:hypothetical protein LEP1GSC047_3776 [Leptospira inadai serovar Lyme str. 10]
MQNRADAFLKLDANRYVLAGQKNENWESLEKNKVTFRILDIPYRKTVDLSPPVAEFAANHPDVFIKATQSERFRTKDRSSNLILILFSLTGQRALRSRIRS